MGSTQSREAEWKVKVVFSGPRPAFPSLSLKCGLMSPHRLTCLHTWSQASSSCCKKWTPGRWPLKLLVCAHFLSISAFFLWLTHDQQAHTPVPMPSLPWWAVKANRTLPLLNCFLARILSQQQVTACTQKWFRSHKLICVPSLDKQKFECHGTTLLRHLALLEVSMDNVQRDVSFVKVIMKCSLC